MKQPAFLPGLSKCEGSLPPTCYFMATLLSAFVAFNSPNIFTPKSFLLPLGMVPKRVTEINGQYL